MTAHDRATDRNTVLVAGATGMLGHRIADHLLQQPGVTVRLLVREPSLSDPAKKEKVRGLDAAGAQVVNGSVNDIESLRRATEGVDIVISALQGGQDVIVDGQLGLANTAWQQGAWRILPSDFALDVFAATPGEHPAFDLRRDAADAIAEIGIEHIHVLNGAFLDGMVHMGFDHNAGTVSYWGSGDEHFEATTVDDTAQFAARAALDRDLISGPFPVVGDRVSANSMTDVVERNTGRTYKRTSNGSVEQLRAMHAQARLSGNTGMQTGLAYMLYMVTGQTRVTAEQNARYPDIEAETFADVARRTLTT